jgi:predicted transcriptional regulator
LVGPLSWTKATLNFFRKKVGGELMPEKPFSEIGKTLVEQMLDTQVSLITQQMSVQEAFAFLKSKNIESCAVVDGMNRLSSTINKSDLLKLVMQFGFDKKIAQCMEKLTPTESLVTLSKSEPMIEAYKKFLTTTVDILYVVDGSGKVLGQVTKAMILELLLKQKSS